MGGENEDVRKNKVQQTRFRIEENGTEDAEVMREKEGKEISTQDEDGEGNHVPEHNSPSHVQDGEIADSKYSDAALDPFQSSPCRVKREYEKSGGKRGRRRNAFCMSYCNRCDQ